MKAQSNFISLVLNAYVSKNPFKRRNFRDVDEGSGQKFRDRSRKFGTK